MVGGGFTTLELPKSSPINLLASASSFCFVLLSIFCSSIKFDPKIGCMCTRKFPRMASSRASEFSASLSDEKLRSVGRLKDDDALTTLIFFRKKAYQVGDVISKRDMSCLSRCQDLLNVACRRQERAAVLVQQCARILWLSCNQVECNTTVCIRTGCAPRSVRHRAHQAPPSACVWGGQRCETFGGRRIDNEGGGTPKRWKPAIPHQHPAACQTSKDRRRCLKSGSHQSVAPGHQKEREPSCTEKACVQSKEKFGRRCSTW